MSNDIQGKEEIDFLDIGIWGEGYSMEAIHPLYDP